MAAACAPAMARPGAFFLDFNSASPGAKQRAAALVDAAGGRYVEGAVMTSIPPYRIKVPLLLGGPARARARTLAEHALGFAAKVASEKLGVASATKMCRSVMIKGLEAMVIESFTTARAYGVEDAVVASLYETFPGIDWEKQGAYFFQRVIEHGRRRSEEVREVAETVREIGLEPQLRPPAPPSARPGWPTWPMDGLFGTKRHEGIRAQQPTGAPKPIACWPTSNPADRTMSKPTTGDFHQDGRLAGLVHRPLEAEAFTLPAGSVDAHCHVFGPGAEFPYAPERKYTPCDASKHQLYALRDHLGFARNVVVQATCHGADNRAMVDALLHSGGKARGVATVKRSVSDAEIQADARRRRARRALQLRQAPGRLHAQGRTAGDRRPHRASGAGTW